MGKFSKGSVSLEGDMEDVLCEARRTHPILWSIFNSANVRKFLIISTRILFKCLNRRSQRNSFNWEQFNLFMRANPLPKGKSISYTHSNVKLSSSESLYLEPIALIWHDGF